MKKFCLELAQKLKHLMVEKNFKKTHANFRINSYDDLPLNKPLNFPILTIIIRCVLQESEKWYPQVYLDDCCMSYKNTAIR